MVTLGDTFSEVTTTTKKIIWGKYFIFSKWDIWNNIVKLKTML